MSDKEKSKDADEETTIVDAPKIQEEPRSEAFPELQISATIYEGTFKADNGQEVVLPTVPREVYALIRQPKVAYTLEKIDLHRFYKLPPTGVDVQRAYELIQNMKAYGNMKITSLEGEEMIVNITLELIAKAL